MIEIGIATTCTWKVTYGVIQFTSNFQQNGILHVVATTYLAESHILSYGFTDIEDVGFLIQYNEETINYLHVHVHVSLMSDSTWATIVQ